MRKEFILEGGPLPSKAALDSASLGHSALLLGLQCLVGDREHGFWAGQSGDPVALERGWACRRAPSPWELEPKHRQALCRVTRGQQGGTAPGLEFVS